MSQGIGSRRTPGMERGDCPPDQARAGDSVRRGTMDEREITRRLKCGTPAVYVNESRLHEGVLVLYAIGLEERLLEPLIERLRAVIVD